jgi:hypothetical protein
MIGSIRRECLDHVVSSVNDTLLRERIFPAGSGLYAMQSISIIMPGLGQNLSRILSGFSR